MQTAVAEVADGLVHEGYGPSKTQRFDGSTARLRFVPARAESTQQLLVGLSYPYFGGRTLRLIQVTDIERFPHRAEHWLSRLDQAGAQRTRPCSEAWSRRGPREATGKAGEDQHALDKQGR
ncbi:MAG: hypothetical protein WDM77_16285 [Steroidobacteraceae bacterium]